MMREIQQLATLYWPTLQVLASPNIGSQNQNRIRSSKRERGYCRSPQHGPIALRITFIPFMIFEICPVKDHYPMAFSDS